jgi:hypothetical protein
MKPVGAVREPPLLGLRLQQPYARPIQLEPL